LGSSILALIIVLLSHYCSFTCTACRKCGIYHMVEWWNELFIPCWQKYMSWVISHCTTTAQALGIGNSHLVINSCDIITINVHSSVLKLHAMLTYFLTKPNSFIKCMWGTLCNTPKWFVAHMRETTDV